MASTKKKNAMKIIQEIIIYATIVEQKIRILVVRVFGFIFSCRMIIKPASMETIKNPIVPEITELRELKIESIRKATGIEVISAIASIIIILLAILREVMDVY